MATSLVKPEVKKIDNALVSLRGRAESLVVHTADDYSLACQVALDGRNYIKRVGFELDPGISKAKETLDHLKNQKDKYVNPAKQIVEIAAQKAEAWKAEERRKAAAEEERINAERRREAARIAEEQRKRDEAAALEARKQREREIEEARKAGEINRREADKLAKQAEQDRLAAKELARKQEAEANANVQSVRVAPAVPKVAGIKARVNWKFRIVNENRLPREYMMPDEVKIGSVVRNQKRAGEVIPGVEAYSEDGI